MGALLSTSTDKSVNALLIILIPIIIFIGLCFLEYFLARKGRLLGLIIPIITFAFSVIFILLQIAPVEEGLFSVVMRILLFFLLVNLPTFVFLILFLAARSQNNNSAKKELDKMNIMDLE